MTRDEISFGSFSMDFDEVNGFLDKLSVRLSSELRRIVEEDCERLIEDSRALVRERFRRAERAVHEITTNSFDSKFRGQ